MLELYSHQKEAIERLRSGNILCGEVGSGKTITALAFYFVKICGGEIEENYIPMKNPIDLYVITTAMKRDRKEWQHDALNFLLTEDKESSIYETKFIVDSWNKIEDYIKVKNAFFIFDEQRVVGSGKWAKSVLKITKNNQWILLSATPADQWSDYIPVFLANGFYKGKTEFYQNHCIFNPYVSYPSIMRYVNEEVLKANEKKIVLNMDDLRSTVQHHHYIFADWDRKTYDEILKTRWDPWKDEPFQNAAGLCYALRRVVNTNPERIKKVQELLKEHKKVIIFYNFDYELEILCNFLDNEKISYSQWNGHKHQGIPCSDAWVYLVQYTAGSEGWNCVETDTIIFYSQNYSYRTTVQASGRIDRLNTKFIDLHYYHILSRSSIDTEIYKALKKKKKFNENKFGG